MAVSSPDVATPEALVTAVMPPAMVALAPLPGTVNVTVTPLTALLPESRTVAERTVPNWALITALWPEPLVTLMEAGAAAVFVRLKFTGVTDGTVAETL